MMKRVIELEENVIIKHKIIVEYENDDELDEAVNNAETSDCSDVFEYADSVNEIVKVLEVHESCYQYSSGIEYFDDYEPKGDKDETD